MTNRWIILLSEVPFRYEEYIQALSRNSRHQLCRLILRHVLGKFY